MFEVDKFKLANGKELNAEEVNILSSMNNEFTHVLFGSKNKVACVKSCRIQGHKHVYLSVEEFANFTSHYPTIAGLNAGRAWFKWQGKNIKTDGVGFYPDVKACPDGFFNTYIEPGIASIPGDCTVYLDHIYSVICNRDERAFDYLIQYLAHAIRKPQVKPSVAVVMRSVEGTGKGTMIKPLLEIFGAQSIQLNGDRHITGQFNSVVANKLFIFADEVDLTSSSTADKLKSFISEPIVQMECKGLEAVAIPNYARIIFASNREHVISAGLRERRYLVLEPSDRFAQDEKYFSRLHSWINDKGANKLLAYLSSVNIDEFNPYKAPTTRALIDQKLQSFLPSYQFIFEQLSNQNSFVKQARIQVSKLTSEYIFWCEARNIKVKAAAVNSQIGKLMTEISDETTGRSGRGEGKVYELPSVVDMQERFAQLLGLSASDIFN